jgi:16S rRNA (cytosine967-C5)-methyltransferase
MDNKKSSNIVFPIIESALTGVHEINKGNLSLDDFLDFKLKDKNLRKTISHLLLAYFCHRQTIENFLRKNLKKSNNSTHEFLSIAIAHIKYQSGIAPESSANAWVEFSKKKYSIGFSKLVNAILRKSLNSNELNQVALPDAIAEKWRKNFGNDFVNDMTQLYKDHAPFTFRSAINIQLSDEFLTKIDGQKLEIDNNIFKWYQAKNIADVLNSNYLKQGEIYIQDIATGFATTLLQKHCKNPKSLLDLCGAPGGKAIMASEIFENKLDMTILDKSAKRQKVTAENLKCRNLKAQILTADAAKFQSDEKYDIIIADVPCSNSGVFRKRPDALWRLNDQSINEIVKIQRSILNNAVNLCAPGSVILYSTCSIEKIEDQEQVKSFLIDYPQFELLEERLILPNALSDGAYAALLYKKI